MFASTWRQINYLLLKITFMNYLHEIASFVLNSFLHIWPYLVITIPLAVIVQLTGAAKYIKRVLSLRPMLAILLATLVGAFSPFCSCGVIPVIATLLIAGVPLAPVMSFWIASPSMDPEIIFLSAATIGWKLTWWRLAATLIISLSAGFITHFAIKKNLLGDNILRTQKVNPVKSIWELIKQLFNNSKQLVVKQKFQLSAIGLRTNKKFTRINNCCSSIPVNECCNPDNKENLEGCECESECSSEDREEKPFIYKLFDETYKATFMVVKFMALAFIINAIIVLYIPSDFITNLLGGDNGMSVLLASIIGVPVYTSNLTALPLIGGLLTQGMNPAAALAFLIAGPTTTLPAMAAVWGITNRKVFMLYLSFSFAGALLFGYIGLLLL